MSIACFSSVGGWDGVGLLGPINQIVAYTMQTRLLRWAMKLGLGPGMDWAFKICPTIKQPLPTLLQNGG